MTESAGVEIGQETFPAGSPVRGSGRTGPEGPREGVGLCLSGGGFRAMLFHVGVLQRLNSAGWLPRLDRVSSVSGGSITAGLLGLRWDELDFADGGVATNFDELVTDPLRRLARTTIDVPSVLTGVLPLTSVSDRVVKKLVTHVFGEATLQDLTDEVRFIVNATNLESGVLLRFSKPYLADYRVGMVERPTLGLAEAVAASAAFPPFLSPFELDLSGADWRTVEGNDLTSRRFRDALLLTDGGVYDNLALETVWDVCRTVLVSDAGGHLEPDSSPGRDWGRSLLRALFIMDSQVRALRRRSVVASFGSREDPHDGFLVRTRTDYSTWTAGRRPYVPVDPAVTARLAEISTRLAQMDDEQQELLVNWGFAAADAGLLAGPDPGLAAAPLPYPHRPLA